MSLPGSRGPAGEDSEPAYDALACLERCRYQGMENLLEITG